MHTFYLLHIYTMSPTRFGISHTIFRENLYVSYSKPPAFTQLIAMVQWLLHNRGRGESGV